MEQYALTSHLVPLNVNLGFNHTFDFSDLFYYCRVYSRIDKKWKELVTTHSKEVFDYTEATARLLLLDKKINIFIPQTYITNRLVSDEIRIDIYTTKGDISINLGNFTQENSKYQWRDLDSDNKNIFSSPLGRLSSLALYSDSVITGGNDGESFTAIRERVIKSRLRRNVPIKSTELEVFLADRGYELIKSVDNITSRVLLAAKELPTYENSQISVQGSISNIAIREHELDRSKIVFHGSSYTLLPTIFFKYVDNLVTMMTQSEEDYLLSLEPEDLIIYLANNDISYNPFHYVFDYSSNLLSLVPYSLTNPTLLSRQKISEDTGLGYQITTDRINLEYHADRYVIKLSTTANKEVKELADNEIVAQLSFIPAGDAVPVYMNGELIGTSGGERIFEFNLKTDFDINRDHNLALKGI